eukprot:28578-Eustigmatos_ZCMA.PRE.1
MPATQTAVQPIPHCLHGLRYVGQLSLVNFDVYASLVGHVSQRLLVRPGMLEGTWLPPDTYVPSWPYLTALFTLS